MLIGGGGHLCSEDHCKCPECNKQLSYSPVLFRHACFNPACSLKNSDKSRDGQHWIHHARFEL